MKFKPTLNFLTVWSEMRNNVQQSTLFRTEAWKLGERQVDEIMLKMKTINNVFLRQERDYQIFDVPILWKNRNEDQTEILPIAGKITSSKLHTLKSSIVRTSVDISYNQKVINHQFYGIWDISESLGSLLAILYIILKQFVFFIVIFYMIDLVCVIRNQYNYKITKL